MSQIIEAILRRTIKQPSDGCWLWTGNLMNKGYGTIRIGRTTHRVHRVAYQELVGPIPVGLFVCHRCDVRNCVRPDHLFLGTALDNNRDRVAKGRTQGLRGETHGMARLSEAEAGAIKSAALSGEPIRDIATRFGVCRTTVHNIKFGKQWGHLSA